MKPTKFIHLKGLQVFKLKSNFRGLPKIFFLLCISHPPVLPLSCEVFLEAFPEFFATVTKSIASLEGKICNLEHVVWAIGLREMLTKKHL